MIKKLQKLLTIAIAISALLSQNLVALSFYSDVTEDHEYYTEIKYLYDKGLLPEYDDNKFRPDDKVKKSEFYKLLLTYAQAEISSTALLPFKDTSNTANYAKHLQTALDLGLIIPIGQNPEFSPDNTLTKQFILKKLFESLGIGTTYFFDQDKFPYIDLKVNSDTAVIAIKASELGINEENNEYFKLAKRPSRAELAYYLYKINQYKPDGKITQVTINTKKSESDDPDLSKFLEIWNTLHDNFLYNEELNNQELIFSALKGMFEEIEDIYTSFQEPQDAEAFLDQLSNEYEGVGMSIDLIDDQVIIVSPFVDSPAEKAGLKPNDIIIKVDDEDIAGLTVNQIVNKIKGPADTTVKITVDREGEILDFDVIREFILYESVQHKIINEGNKQIGYIQVITFAVDTYSEFEEAANTMVEEEVDGLIIDLRSNPGGYLEIVIGMISLFTEEATPALLIETADGTQEKYRTAANGLLKDFETVVLINKGSASASEIMAGALQDYGIAKIIGEISFGKGTIQQLQEFDDGSLFKYTIAKWLTPNARDINGIGITPDKIVEQKNGTTIDEQLEAALAEF